MIIIVVFVFVVVGSVDDNIKEVVGRKNDVADSIDSLY